VDSHTQKALDAIAAALAYVRELPPVELSPQYLAMVRAVEALPENQPGTDKQWVWRAYEYCRRHFANMKPV